MSGQSAALTLGMQQRMITINELRVFDLKQELEKRGLDKNGVKSTLIERLETALREEGHDPKTFLFAVVDYGKNASTVKNFYMRRNTADEEVTEFTDEDKEVDDGERSCRKEEDESIGSAVVDEEIGKTKEEHEIIKVDPDDGSLKLTVSEVPSKFNGQKSDTLAEGSLLCDSGSQAHVTSIKGETEDILDPEEMRSKISKVEDLDIKKDSSGVAETAISTSTVTVGKPSSCHSQSVLKKSLDTSLWIRGIGPNTKAADLQALFSKYGRVITAKIYTRRQQPSGACFGFVTMVDSVTADLCIHKLNKTSVKGRVISIERADRSNMPFLKSVKKKVTASTCAAQKSASVTINSERSKSEERAKSSRELSLEKEKKEKTSLGKSKGTGSVEKASTHSGSDKQKGIKTASSAKKIPVTAPSTSTPQYKSRPSLRERAQTTRLPPRFRAGRRLPERTDRFASLRRPFSSGIRKPIFASGARRPGLSSGRIPLSSRSSRLSRFARREVSSRRVEPSWDKREVMEVLRKKEEEHRLKEQELRLQRERERLKFERERIERERLELQQWRQMGQFATPQIPSMIPISRRSHESYDDVHSSSHHRNEYTRSGDDRHSPGHRSSSGSARVTSSERREPHVSSRHVSASHHSSSRAISDRERSRHGRDRESRNYSSSSPRELYSRDTHSGYGRNVDASASNYGKDAYRGAEVSYNSSHRSGDLSYSSRDMGYSGNYGGNSSRSGGSSSWQVGGGISGYISSSSRDYDTGSSWMSSMASSQPHGISSSQWQSSRTIDNWSSGDNYGQQGSHNSSYEKSYDKYDSYDKYGRRY